MNHTIGHTFMAAHDALDRRQADAGTRKVVRAVQALEHAEQAVRETHVETGTVVVHREPPAAVPISGVLSELIRRSHRFRLDPDHPNALAPGKRPYHTIIPALATKSDLDRGEELFASFGVMGGFMQPQGHLQVVVSMVDDQLNPQAALDQPRFCINEGQAGGGVALEEGINQIVMDQLSDMGHDIEPVSGHGRSLFGRGQIILRDAESGVLCGGSDPRADGCAMSL